jgi:hypothetical protein
MIKIQEHFKKLSGQVNIFVNCLQSAFYVWKRVATPKVIKNARSFDYSTFVISCLMLN